MKEIIDKIAGLIADAVLSPLIYMVEHDGRIDFIYISNEEISEDVLYNVQMSASGMLNCDVDILDIRYFSEFDKISLIQKSQIVYCENPILPKIIELRSIESLRDMIKEKDSVIERKKEYDCYYLQ